MGENSPKGTELGKLYSNDPDNVSPGGFLGKQDAEYFIVASDGTVSKCSIHMCVVTKKESDGTRFYGQLTLREGVDLNYEDNLNAAKDTASFVTRFLVEDSACDDASRHTSPLSADPSSCYTTMDVTIYIEDT